MFSRALRSVGPTLSRASLSPLVIRQVARPASLLRSAELALSTSLRSYSEESSSLTGRHYRPGRGPRKEHPPSNRLFVGNLSYGTDSDALLDMCKEYGAESAHVGTKTDGSFQAYGFVTFPSTEVATEAINSLTSRESEGEPLAANYAETEEMLRARRAARRSDKPSEPPAPQLYLGNLRDVETEALEAVIEPLLEGIPYTVRRGYYKETGVLHPFAFLKFDGIQTAIKAKESLGNLKVYDTRIFVNFPRAKEAAEDSPRRQSHAGQRGGGGRDGYARVPRQDSPSE